jgi:hypothetical protein
MRVNSEAGKFSPHVNEHKTEQITKNKKYSTSIKNKQTKLYRCLPVGMELKQQGYQEVKLFRWNLMCEAVKGPGNINEHKTNDCKTITNVATTTAGEAV